MGKKARMKQEHLAEKLIQIRNALGLSQSEMLSRLGFEDVLDYKRISEYELGKNEPPLAVLLRYARVAGICMDVLIDDEMDLPAKLPSKLRHRH
ncbi:MAG TPA: helix-turn-helix transcriptional regulator [Pyrinomonadaceae bacterium]|nr:helix-turn-helix transcriptional regulator [Pyrinomonadaceae bacterium]